MGDLPVCKLCGCQPTRNPDGKLGHKRGSRCKLVSAVYFNDEEWQTLMSAPGGAAVAERSPKAPGGINWLCETLPERGAKLFLHPAPAVDDDVLRDAARYKWLREKIQSGYYVIAYEGAWGLRSWSGDDPDRAIDNAIKKEQDNANRTF